MSNAAIAQSPDRTLAVVELFTSQGCSSCPPADAVLETYATRDDVIALSLPVDYWDSLGWKDTFGSRAHSDRQRDYAVSRGDGAVYTPQVVVNGRLHVNGSSQLAIEQGLAETRRTLARDHVPIRLTFDGASLVVEAGSAASASTSASGTVWLAAVQRSGIVAIGRGENRGRKITYANIVRALKPIGTWSGSPISIRVAPTDLAVPGTQSAVVLLQQGVGGPLIGAARIATHGGS